MPEEEMTSEEVEEVVPPVEEEQKTEEVEEDGFVKKDEVVSIGKHNQAIRKLREAELEKRELEKQLAEAKGEKPVEKEEEEDFFKDEEESKKKALELESLVDAKVKPVLERLNQKEADDKKNQRTAFFEEHPQYLKDAEAWQELLDEVDNFSPHSKDGYYKQLIKAHRIISSEDSYSEIDKKKKDMASESASKDDGSQKAADRKSSADEREDRLTRDMPKGFVYKERK